MAYENRTVQSTTANALPTGTDPLVDNTASGDVQAIKLLNPTAGSVAPWINQAARTQSLPVALSTEDAALLQALIDAQPEAITGFLTEGTPITGETVGTGGAGALGWLSSIRKAITDRLPAALVGGRLDVNIGASSATVPVSGTVAVSNFPATQAVSIASAPALVASSARIGKVTVRNAADSADIDPLSETDFDTKIGALTETAPATDTASSGLNGRLQRIAQRLTSLIALLPTSLGQTTKANSLSVALASNQDALPITDNSGSLTVDGTVAATQSGTWTVQPGNTVNTTAWKVDGSAVSQPILAVNLVPTFTSGSSLNADLVAAFDASNYRSGSLQLTGTWVGTVQVQAALDAGTTWIALRIRKQDGTYSTSQTGVGIYEFGVPTGAQIRIRITAYSSGTVTGAAALTSLAFAPIAVEQTPTNLSATAVSGPTASGVADSGAPVKGATKYNATLTTFTDGNRADMQGDANGFLRVTAQPTITIASTPTVSTSPAYTSGDSVGGKISLASAVRLAGTGGTITSVTITDKGKQSAAIDVVFFNADPTNTTFTDNGALTVHDTDLLTIIGVVPITSWAAFVDNSVGYANGLGLGYKIATGTTLYACLVTRGTPTYAATTDIQLVVGIIPD
jgi:hypothetical protein